MKEKPTFSTEETALRHRCRIAAAQCGFVACGAVKAEAVASWRVRQFHQWLRDGKAAAMDYLHRHFPMRCNPKLLMPEVRTIFSFAMPYEAHPCFTPEALRLARYALGDDYHNVVRRHIFRFMELLGYAASCPSDTAHGRVFCDTAPVDERYWAWRSGVGEWLDSGLISTPEHGTFIVLGEWFSPYTVTEMLEHLPETQPAAPDSMRLPEAASCLHCGLCFRACPGGALNKEGVDARRCLSYLTIEHRGSLPPGTGKRMSATFYGCDRCAEVCPLNQPLISGSVLCPPVPEELRARPCLLQTTAEEWQSMTPETYRQIFKGSAAKRAKYEGLKRNIEALNMGQWKFSGDKHKS